jgi:7-carboxy-7-deazaguanine synthase (Cx14CxxC type)
MLQSPIDAKISPAPHRKHQTATGAGVDSLFIRKKPLTYSVKEIFYTLQGEGAQAGRPAVFCRFSGCNLWTGRESDRNSAVCKFCDTDFVGTDGQLGAKYRSAEQLAATIDSQWPAGHPGSKYVVFTGGEPLLQLDADLTAAVHAQGFEIAIETNGTLPVPAGVDWVCVSPKMGAELHVRQGSELKLVIPQAGQALDDYLALDFAHFFLQPMDGPDLEKNTRLAIDTCMRNPRWKLSLQTHKLLHIP